MSAVALIEKIIPPSQGIESWLLEICRWHISTSVAFAAAKAMMDQSRMALNEAHLVQTKLIEGDAGEGKMKVSLVLVHAQDHLMTSMLARELITELIELHEKLKA